MADEDWAERRAPSLAEFDALAAAAFARLPEMFRRLCEGVVIRVVDIPDDATLDEMDLDSPFDLLGLFRGRGLPEGGFARQLQTGQLPNMIWLYRRPILDYWAEHDETLGAIVTHVLVHEIGHHVGLSDDDMARIEAGDRLSFATRGEETKPRLSRCQPTQMEMAMDKDRIEGAVEKAKGAAKDIAGRITGDTKLEAEGKAQKAGGTVQNAVGGAKDALRGKA